MTDRTLLRLSSVELLRRAWAAMTAGPGFYEQIAGRAAPRMVDNSGDIRARWRNQRCPPQ